MIGILQNFFDSDNRRYEASILLAVIACIVGIMLQVYVVIFAKGSDHQAFNMKDFGAGFCYLFVGTGAYAWGAGQGRKAQAQGNAAQNLVDKVPPITGEESAS